MQYANDLQEFLVMLAPLFLLAAGAILAILIVLVVLSVAVNVLVEGR